jgi:glycosyltransferase involved in cell wall biosynthesis
VRKVAFENRAKLRATTPQWFQKLLGTPKETMQVTFIACPFKTSYGAASESLKKALERKLRTNVQWVASNCGCGDDVEVARQFQMPGCCKYFDAITITDHPSRNRWKLWLKLAARKFFYYFRARKYHAFSVGAEVVNFQQTLNAYGSTVLFHWLKQRSPAARVITIHELDRHQLNAPDTNRAYNQADAIIVQQGAMRDQLIGLGVDPSKIEIVLHGTDLPAIYDEAPREGVMYYCGHHPFNGKGLREVFQAIALLKKRLGTKAPRLKVHGYFSREDLETLKGIAAQSGIENDVVWLNQPSMQEVLQQYGSSALCVLPFTASFAGLAASTAAAVGLPIIATKNAGIVEHIGENGIWLESDSAEEIAAQVERLLGADALRRDLGKRLRQRAEQYLSWDVVAESTLAVYDRALERKHEQGSGCRHCYCNSSANVLDSVEEADVCGSGAAG